MITIAELSLTELGILGAAVSSIIEFGTKHEQTRSLLRILQKSMIYHKRTEEEIDRMIELTIKYAQEQVLWEEEERTSHQSRIS